MQAGVGRSKDAGTQPGKGVGHGAGHIANFFLDERVPVEGNRTFMS